MSQNDFNSQCAGAPAGFSGNANGPFAPDVRMMPGLHPAGPAPVGSAPMGSAPMGPFPAGPFPLNSSFAGGFHEKRRFGSSFFSGCAVGCSGCLIPFFFLVLFGILCGTSISEKVSREVLSGPKDEFGENCCDKVAVICVNETIMEDDGFINDQINDVANDETIKAIVLRMNTPGGSVSTSDFYYNKLTKLRKETGIPIVVSMGGMCASGGYYVAMACGNETPDVLFAEPTTWTGSIGVIISNYDLTALAEKIGIKEDSIRSHELKGMGSLARPLTEKERAILQALVDDAFARFRNVVFSGRKNFNENHDLLTPLATGQVFTTSDALKSGLIDREGYLEDAIKRAMELAGLEESSTQVFTYHPQETLADLMMAAKQKMTQTQAESVREMLSPRAYYLWSVGN